MFSIAFDRPSPVAMLSAIAITASPASPASTAAFAVATAVTVVAPPVCSVMHRSGVIPRYSDIISA